MANPAHTALIDEASQAHLSLSDDAFAQQLDHNDPLRQHRSAFHFPRRPDGSAVMYMTGNSLGLQHVDVAHETRLFLDKWANHAVRGHFVKPDPWFDYASTLQHDMASLVGARDSEVVVMNTLTVNIHLLMCAFYHPQGERRKILIENQAFPSDTHCVVSQLTNHGLDAERDLVVVSAPGHDDWRSQPVPIPTECFVEAIHRHRNTLSLVIIPAIHFITGQLLDIATIVRAAHAHGIVVGVDCAHAAGNVPLRLHDWDVDFACWCTYKYMNSGPGNIGAAFVHERHTSQYDQEQQQQQQHKQHQMQGNTGSNAQPDTSSLSSLRVRVNGLHGWWGNAVRTRFSLKRAFDPMHGASAFQISNTCVCSMVMLRPALRLMASIGMPTLRAKSLRLTGYLELLIRQLIPAGCVEIVTPADPEQRGAQLSLRIVAKKLLPQVYEFEPEANTMDEDNIEGGGESCTAVVVEKKLLSMHLGVDCRPPDIIRVAPVPLYNSYEDVLNVARTLASLFVQ